MANILSLEGMKEKESIKNMVGDLIVACLWNPKMDEAHGETLEHDITVWREHGVVKAVIKHK